MITNEKQLTAELTTKCVNKAGSIAQLAVDIDANEKSIYKWWNKVSMPDAKHLFAMMVYVDWVNLPDNVRQKYCGE